MPLTFTDVVAPNPDFLCNGNGGANAIYTFSHNILDNGYKPVTDLLTSASITLRFADESNDAALESLSFDFDGSSFEQQTITSGGTTFLITFANSGLTGLLADGVLNVTLQNAGMTNANPDDRGDFKFLDSTLTATVDRSATTVAVGSVPEPHALGLLGLASAGAAFVGRGDASKMRDARAHAVIAAICEPASKTLVRNTLT